MNFERQDEARTRESQIAQRRRRKQCGSMHTPTAEQTRAAQNGKTDGLDREEAGIQNRTTPNQEEIQARTDWRGRRVEGDQGLGIGSDNLIFVVVVKKLKSPLPEASLHPQSSLASAMCFHFFPVAGIKP